MHRNESRWLRGAARQRSFLLSASDLWVSETGPRTECMSTCDESLCTFREEIKIMNHYTNSTDSGPAAARCGMCKHRNRHACSKHTGHVQNITYQSYCVCLCAANDSPRPPASCAPPRLRPGRKKKRTVRVGGAEEGRDIAYRKQTRPYSTKASKDTRPSSAPWNPLSLCPHSSGLLFFLLLTFSPHLSSLSFPLSSEDLVPSFLTIYICLPAFLFPSSFLFSPSFSPAAPLSILSCCEWSCGLRSPGLFTSQTDMKAKHLSMGLRHGHAIMGGETSSYS